MVGHGVRGTPLNHLLTTSIWVAISESPPQSQEGISESRDQSHLNIAHRYKVLTGGPYPHLVTCSILRWFPVFTSGDFFKIIIDSLQYLRANRGLAVHAHAIMPTHTHAVTTATNDDLSAIMRDFKRFTSRSIYQEAEKQGNELMSWVFRTSVQNGEASRFKVWQDGFHPKAIISGKTFLRKVEYVHLNPARKGLVLEPENYYYSSAAAYCRDQMGPLEIDMARW